MSRHLLDENYYISHAKKIPIKWTASEVSTLLMLCISYIINCITKGYISNDTLLPVMCGVLELHTLLNMESRIQTI